MANQLLLSFALCIYFFGGSSGLRDVPKLTQHDAISCVLYNSTVKKFSADIWLVRDDYSNCTFNDTDRELKILRVVSKLVNASPDNPVVFVTRMGEKVETWKLPLKPTTFSRSYDQFTHTLCSRPSLNNTSLSLSGYDHETDDITMYMDVFTSNVTGVEYSFEFQPVEDFVLKLDQNILFQVSPSETHLRYFRFPKGVNAVRVVLSSKSSNNCAIVSVQNASCPVNDQLNNAMSKGIYQTMITSASIVVTVDDHREFFVVVVSADQSVCNRLKEHDNSSIQAHHMTLEILELKPASSFVGAVLFPLILFLFIGITTLCVFMCPCIHCSFILFNCTDCLKIRLGKQPERKNYELLSVNGDETDTDESDSVSHDTNTTRHGSIPEQQASTTGAEVHDTLERTVNTLEENESRLYINSLTRRGYTDLERSYNEYGWNTITIGIFYGLPAFQLVFSQQMNLNDNGDQDICYYNFKCSHPYLSLSAFNNVWSNIGYLIMGLTFLGVVAVRNYRANQERKNNSDQFNKYGVPQFFGLYYAMGFALVMEAFMSSFYHICPGDNNFQFDTAFMFIIGGLLIVKMLQARHPDIQANAFVAFFCFAIVIFLTFIGIWEWSKVRWQTKFFLFILAMIGILVFAVSYYFFHDWRFSHWIEAHMYKKIYDWFRSWCVLCNSKENAKQLLPKYPYRFVKITLLVVANIGAGFPFVLTDNGIATAVLTLFVTNFLILFLLYIICKLWYREPITLMPVVFLILLGVFWSAAFYFYFTNVSEWEGSPAESREYNKDCIVMKFYDNHDIWHFLSAGAVFFSFLFLLTLDDGTQALERKKIHVF